MNGVIHYAIFRLTLFIAEFSRCHGVLLLEVTREDAGVAEAAGRGYVRDGHVRTVREQKRTVTQSTFIDIIGEGCVGAALREGGTNMLFAQTETIHQVLTVEKGIEIQLLAGDHTAQVLEQLGIRHR